MAIVWGPWVANDRWRVGVELSYSPSTVTASTASVTVTAAVWFQVRYASSESGQPGTKWGLSGDLGAFAAENFSWSLGSMGTKKLGSHSASVALNYGASKKVTVLGSATVDYTYPGSGSVSASITLPARPLTAPAAPSGVSLVRGSGESLTVSWTRNATSTAPYSSVEVQWANTKQSGYYPGATVSGSATSYASTGYPDRGYRARVRAVNSAGASAWVESNLQHTTPATPPAPVANKNAAGDVVVGLLTPAAGSTAVNYEIWHAADGVWDGARLALVPSGSGSWTHPSPDPAKSHTYRLRAVSSTPVLYSGYSATSKTVNVPTQPNPPTIVSPTVAVDAARPVVVEWLHNAVDTYPQSAFNIRWRTGGGAWVYVNKQVSSEQSYTLPAGTLTNGLDYELQVQTWGHPDVLQSNWSASQLVSTSATPMVAVTSPDGVTPVDSSRLTVTWGYAQADGSPQAQWRARLADGGGAILQTLSGSDSASEATFTKPILDGQSYYVGVSVRSAAGVWSDEQQVPFTVDYAEPPAPVVTPYWRPDEGAVVLDVYVSGPAEGQPEAVRVDVFRAIEGDEWRLIAGGVTPGASVTDFTPPLGRLVTYKAVATSALPSSAESSPVEVLTDRARFVFVNGGPGFSQSARLNANIVVDISSSRAKGVHTFAGGRRVEWTGDARSRVLGIKSDLFAAWAGSALVHEASTWEEVEALADLPGPHCYRDPDGRRFFVSMSDPSIGGIGVGAARGVAFTLTEFDWEEPVGSDDV